MKNCLFSSWCLKQLDYSQDSNSEGSGKHCYLGLTKNAGNSFETRLQYFTPHQLMQKKKQSGHRLKIFDWVISVLGMRQAKPVVK